MQDLENNNKPMGRFGLGLRILFRIWSDEAFAEQVKDLEAGKLTQASKPKAAPKVEPASAPREVKVSRRSEALTLLAALQREARFVDFIKEAIAGYSDAQIGAAVRHIHKSCGGVLDRFFAVQPLAQEAEGQPIEVPRGFDPAQFRLTGSVSNEPPFRGKISHQGWKATKCELPEWTGSEAASLVVAPVEVEIK
jgi:hypothetical protein